MRLLLAVNSLWFLRSHRRAVVAAALADGWEVHVAAGRSTEPRDEAAAQEFTAMGARLHLVPLDRASMHPWDLLRTTRQLLGVMRAVRPELVHLVTPKVTICGGIAARLARIPGVVAAISGLGILFAGDSMLVRLRAAVVRGLYALALRHEHQVVIVQNGRDQDVLAPLLPAATRFVRLHGSGVDLDRFAPQPPPAGVPVVLLAARMLRDKGIPEFAEAARRLHARGVAVRMVLCGSPDPANPTSLTEAQLQALVADGTVEYWGFQDDMAACYAKASIACLPSGYGEGLPLALAEAAAAGRPIVTTDTPGCRDTVEEGVNGLLVPVRNAGRLAEAIEELLSDPARRRSMGDASRRLAEQRFGVAAVTAGHLAVYSSLVPRRPGGVTPLP